LDIPAEVAILSTIKPGSVYYFHEDTLHSTEPHYFIAVLVVDVIPSDETTDETVLLVCASSKITKVKRRRSGFPEGTLVEISPTEYTEFSVDSVIDCNVIWQKSVSELVQKLSRRELLLKAKMKAGLIKKIRKGVLISPTVERSVKSLLKP